MSSRPTARTTCPRSGRNWPTRRIETGWPNGALIPLCKSVSPSTSAWRLGRGCSPGVKERLGAQRRLRLEPLAVDGTSAPALETASVAPGPCVRPLPRTWPSLGHGSRAAPPWPRTVCGPRAVSRSQRTRPRLSAVARPMAIAPHDVCGAGPQHLYLSREIKAGHVTAG
jgi:hypothetical protein